MLQTGLAAACHQVGDVHVICHEGGLKLVYTQNDTMRGISGHGDMDDMPCCEAPTLTDSHRPPPIILDATVLPRPHEIHIAPVLRITTPTPPKRGPPSVSLL